MLSNLRTNDVLTLILMLQAWIDEVLSYKAYITGGFHEGNTITQSLIVHLGPSHAFTAHFVMVWLAMMGIHAVCHWPRKDKTITDKLEMGYFAGVITLNIIWLINNIISVVMLY